MEYELPEIFRLSFGVGFYKLYTPKFRVGLDIGYWKDSPKYHSFLSTPVHEWSAYTGIYLGFWEIRVRASKRKPYFSEL